MSCYSVYLKSNDKQIKVFPYDRYDAMDRMIAKTLAIEFALNNANNGYDCLVEQFHNQDIIGVSVFDSEYPFI